MENEGNNSYNPYEPPANTEVPVEEFQEKVEENEVQEKSMVDKYGNLRFIGSIFVFLSWACLIISGFAFFSAFSMGIYGTPIIISSFISATLGTLSLNVSGRIIHLLIDGVTFLQRIDQKLDK